MENSRWDPNASIVCPYDATHVLSVKRFQRHLVKCRQNHPEKDFVTCPFNARHMFLRSDLRKHLSHCADKVTLDADVVKEEDPETGEMLRLKGKTEMPKAPEHIANSTEDWDDEIEENLVMKYAEQEEYLRMQGIIGKQEEEPILRRPNLPIVNKPCLPLINRPVNISEGGQLTSLRRPNLPVIDKETSTEISSRNSCMVADEERNEKKSSIISSLPIVGVETDEEVQSTMSEDIENCTSSTNSTTNINIYESKEKGSTRNSTDKAPHHVCKSKQSDGTLCNERQTVNMEENSVRSENSKTSYQNVIHKTTAHDITNKLNIYAPLINKFSNTTLSHSANGIINDDCDTESVASDSTWASSVHEPLKRYSNNSVVTPNLADLDKEPTPYISKENKLLNGINNKSNGVAGHRNVQGVSRGSLLHTLEGSAFTAVIPKQTVGVAKENVDASIKEPAIGRGMLNGHVLQNKPVSDEKPKIGFGRGNLKQAALNFQRM